jgi:hypothetical protein
MSPPLEFGYMAGPRFMPKWSHEPTKVCFPKAYESLRLLTSDIAVVICSWRMGTGPRARAGLMTVVSRKEGEAWQIIALHNTDLLN